VKVDPVRADRRTPEPTLPSVISDLRSAAYLLCGSWTKADDLLQVTALKVHRNLSKIRDAQALPAYAHQTMYRTFLDQLRRDRRRREVLHAEVPEQAAPEPARPDEALVAAVAALPPRQRACIVLRYFEDRSIEQVAETMDIDPGTVKSQTKRALDTLRITLDPDEASFLGEEGGR
jgi:RNA polymerase sigma-70 factor (sigma-E family)